MVWVIAATISWKWVKSAIKTPWTAPSYSSKRDPEGSSGAGDVNKTVSFIVAGFVTIFGIFIIYDMAVGVGYIVNPEYFAFKRVAELIFQPKQ